MSNQNTTSFSTFSTFSSSTFTSTSSHSSSSTNSGGTHSYTQRTASNPSGTTIHRTAQEPGKPAVSQTTHIPTSGGGAAARQQVEGLDAGGRRIEDVTDREADRLYEERIEEEYAKREGGS